MTDAASIRRGARLGEWLLLYAFSVVAALLLSAILVEATGGDWRPVVNALLDGSLLKSGRWGDTLGTAAPILIVAVGTVVLPGWKRRAFAGTAVSSACWVAGGFLWWRRGWSNAWGPKPTALLPVAAVATSAMIVQRFIAAERAAPQTLEPPA